MENTDSFNLDNLFEKSESESETENGVSKIETSRLFVNKSDSESLTPNTPDTLDGVLGFYDNSKDVNIDKESDNDSVVTVIETKNNGNNNNNNNIGSKDISCISSNCNSTLNTIKNINSKRFYSSKVLIIDKDKDTVESSITNTNTGSDTNYNPFEILKSLPIESMQKIESMKDNCTNLDSCLEIFNEIVNILNILKGINNKGYINDTNLLSYPLLNECIINGMYVKERDPDSKNDDDKKPKPKPIAKKGISVNLGDDDVISIETAKDLFK